ncbi:hypothetical protein ACFC1T_09005 [Kitasatospora sp. NPDC056076]|uniref:hypothetical protein n=1 Tax=Kitasatospora sp. NPDC056076 TaxID=3345703 RepID=UPI0035E2EB59
MIGDAWAPFAFIDGLPDTVDVHAYIATYDEVPAIVYVYRQNVAVLDRDTGAPIGRPFLEEEMELAGMVRREEAVKLTQLPGKWTATLSAPDRLLVKRGPGEKDIFFTGTLNLHAGAAWLEAARRVPAILHIATDCGSIEAFTAMTFEEEKARTWVQICPLLVDEDVRAPR